HLEHAVAYYFYDYSGAGHITKVLSDRFPGAMNDGNYQAFAGFTGPDVKAAELGGVIFPQLLEPVDDVPPATIITSIVRNGDGMRVRGVSEDNGEIESVIVNGKNARLHESAAGVVDWEIQIESARLIEAKAKDGAGNAEVMSHRLPAF